MRFLASVVCVCMFHLLALCVSTQAQSLQVGEIGGSVTGAAQDTVLLTGARTDWPAMLGAVGYLRDPEGEMRLDEVLSMDPAHAFRSLTTETADFGYTRDAIWLRFRVENQGPSEQFRLAFRENFLHEFAVWFVDDDGRVELLERQDQTSPFSTRRVAHPELVVPLDLPEQARGTVYLRYASGGSSELSWTIFDAGAFADWAGHKAAKNFVYYGMMLLLMSAAFIGFLMTRRVVFGAYAFYALFAQLFVMHADGNTFQYLWPNLPRFNAYATVPLGAGLIISGAYFGRIFLQTRRFHRYFDRALLAMIVTALGLFAATAVIDTQPIKHLLIFMAFLTTILLALAGFNAARTRFREVRFYVIAWVGAVISSGMMTLRHWFGVEISEELQFDSIRVVLVVDAIMMGLAILDRFNQMKRARQKALELSLAEAHKSLQLGRRLQDLEKQVDLAERLSSAERQTLKETVHDLRQPLNALRLNIRHLADGEQSPAAVAEIETAIGYLEELAAAELGRVLDRKPAEAAGQNGAGATPLGPAFATVVDMFAPEAEEKGISLRMVDTRQTVAIPPLELMRMLSNLVANAVKATQQGSVLLGVRRAGGLRIEVHDTGEGMDETLFQAARERAMRDPTDLPTADENAGLGLSIVHDIARRYGLRCDYVLHESRGTCLRLWLTS